MMRLNVIENLFSDLVIYDDFPGSLPPLQSYFPPNIIIYEYNASENRIIRTVSVKDVEEWFRNKMNRKFLFQCLLCCQEMDFTTVFCRGHSPINRRSHLLTMKHNKKVKNIKQCVGVLYVSSPKFVICSSTEFNDGKIFNATSMVKRRNELLIKNDIQNKIFCSNYKMYSFDRKTKTLSEIDYEEDVVQFMIREVRPIFSFHCTLCDIRACAFTTVVTHLLGKKHLNKLGTNKAVIIASKDFNVFILCDLDKLSSFLFLEHLNSYLEEIVIASDENIIISGCHIKEGKPIPTEGGIKVKANPIKLPNGLTKDESVKIQTRYQNRLTDTSSSDISDSLINIFTPGQRNATIYQFSPKNFEEKFTDNSFLISMVNGCRIWCSRCRRGIYSVEALLNHLSSLEHSRNVRNNEQDGFMCHFCNVFFIKLKGEHFFHIHSSSENKNIIKQLKENQPSSLDFNSPLNRSIMRTYSSLLRNMKEVCKFCCLGCYDVAKPHLMHLGSHEISTAHKNACTNIVYTFCPYCNVIYIEDEQTQITAQFKTHFAIHINETNTSINYTIYTMGGISIDEEVNESTFTVKYISSATVYNNYEKLNVKSSERFNQLLYPGVSSEEFSVVEKWDEQKFTGYLNLYLGCTGKKIDQFSCLTCKCCKLTLQQIIHHLFNGQHQKSQMFTKKIFVKICDICHILLLSQKISDLQEHFLGLDHMTVLSMKTGIQPAFLTTRVNKPKLAQYMSISKDELNTVIESYISNMRALFVEREEIFKKIEKDILKIVPNYPNLAVYFIGSRESGFATPNSDCNISLQIDNQHFDEIITLWQKNNNTFSSLSILSRSHFEFKAVHEETGILCNFVLETTRKNCHISKLIRFYIEFDTRVLWLLAAVRHWAEVSDLIGTGLFSTSEIVWLLLFYLMQPDVHVIPPVSYVTEKCGSLENIRSDGMNKQEWISNNKGIGHISSIGLLIGFLNYYSLLKLSEYKLCTGTGLIIPRVADDVQSIFLQDPFDNTKNMLRTTMKDISEKLTATCYLSLHMPWRWAD